MFPRNLVYEQPADVVGASLVILAVNDGDVHVRFPQLRRGFLIAPSAIITDKIVPFNESERNHLLQNKVNVSGCFIFVYILVILLPFSVVRLL